MEDLHENASDMDIMLLQILKTTPGKKNVKKNKKSNNISCIKFVDRDH